MKASASEATHPQSGATGRAVRDETVAAAAAAAVVVVAGATLATVRDHLCDETSATAAEAEEDEAGTTVEEAASAPTSPTATAHHRHPKPLVPADPAISTPALAPLPQTFAPARPT